MKRIKEPDTDAQEIHYAKWKNRNVLMKFLDMLAFSQPTAPKIPEPKAASYNPQFPPLNGYLRAAKDRDEIASRGGAQMVVERDGERISWLSQRDAVEQSQRGN